MNYIKKIVKCLLLTIVFLSISVYSYGNSFDDIELIRSGSDVCSIAYSNDFFTNDSVYANQIKVYAQSAGYSASAFARPTISYAWNTMMANNHMFYVSTHGNGAGSKPVLDETSTGYTYYNPNGMGTVVCNVVFFSACSSAKTNTDTGINLLSKAINKGAGIALGYKYTVILPHSRVFERTFFHEYCSSGDSSSTAFYEAIIETQSVYGSSTNISSNAKIYGNMTQYFDD